MNNEKKTWGGARRNAGRMKKYAKRVTFSATQDVLDILQDCKGNMSEFICSCIVGCRKGD